MFRASNGSLQRTQTVEISRHEHNSQAKVHKCQKEEHDFLNGLRSGLENFEKLEMEIRRKTDEAKEAVKRDFEEQVLTLVDKRKKTLTELDSGLESDSQKIRNETGKLR